jgi:pimeloyl-ACP methyl ester carboxylesterase
MNNIVIYVVAGYLLVIVLAYLVQEKLIFKPEKLHANFQFKFDVPFRELFFEIEPGVSINGLHFFRENAKGLVLYFHGNTRSIKGWARYAKDFYRYNYDVVLVDYRGFGKSTGKKGETAMLKDMQHVYEKLTATYLQGHMIIYGRSMGSGFAAKIAADNDPRYLILDAPYYNFQRVVKRLLPVLPVSWMLRYHLPTHEWLKEVKCHTYIIHGTKDRLIPISNSEKLQEVNPKKITLIRIHGGGHNNLPTFPEYHNFIRDILKE